VPLVLEDRSNGVLTVTLNRPERRNGITGPLVEELLGVLRRAGADDSLRVAVLQGAGGAFCSGMDLAEKVRPDELTFMRRVASLCGELRELPMPTVAKVSGPAVGFGANLALCCDLVLAADDAVFGEVFSRLGLTLDGGGSWSLPRLVGLQKAKEIAFFGERLTGAQAAELGMVNRAVPAAHLDEVVGSWAAQLAAGPKRSLATIKASLNSAYDRSFREALDAETLSQALFFRSPEAKEGVRAHLERRDADFRALD